MTRYSFIMPFHNRWDLTLNRLNEFRKFLPPDCEIVLVDDCSTDTDVDAGIAFWQKSGIMRQNVLYKKNTENVGFSTSQNNGARIASGDYFVFYSNDVVMYRNIIPELDAAFDSNEKVLVGNRLIDWDSGWNELNGKPVPYLEGYFIACSREAYKEIHWDERYRPYDYEDIDLSLQAVVLGYNLVALNSTAIKHLGGQTIYKMNPEREKVTKRNRIKFIEKWSGKL